MTNPEDFAASWAKRIAAEQAYTTENIAGATYLRIRYGADYPDLDLRPRCRDCGCALGQIHVDPCCVERCARCLGQRIPCSCPCDALH
jgi:hypothetical protein